LGDSLGFQPNPIRTLEKPIDLERLNRLPFDKLKDDIGYYLSTIYFKTSL